jgi:lipopolysaccharide transport system ATP-binding protein
MTCRVVLDNVGKVFRSTANSGGRIALRDALRRGAASTRQREIRAVDGVSLELGEGERLGIVGRNGAGKSTLLHLIAGLTEPSFGRVEVAGRIQAVMTLGAVLRDEATGRENIYLDGAVQNRSRAEIDRMIDRIIDFSELGAFIDRPVRTYSTGMKARLAFSMTAFIEPEILVIDEALSVGDVHFAGKANARMRALAAAGRIVIVVSHALGSIVELCSRCIWLDCGRIVMDGAPREVAAAYQRAVDQTDEAALRRKFADAMPSLPADARGALTGLRIRQDDATAGTATSVRALADTVFEITGYGAPALCRPDLSVRITRSDGAVICEDRLHRHADPAVLRGGFRLSIGMRPLTLGQHAYRLDAVLCDGDAAVAARSVVFEVRDEEGQVGGVPMILYPPVVTASVRAEIAA